MENLRKRIRFFMPNVPMSKLSVERNPVQDEFTGSECVNTAIVNDIEMSDEVNLID